MSNLEFIYATDLHGDIEKYDKIFNYAVECSIPLIHIGSDILPKGESMLERQKRFIKGYLKEFYKKCKEKNIDVLAFFGNDDVYSRKRYFRDYAMLLDETIFMKKGYYFQAYGYVQDHPFGLKNGCKLDRPGWTCQEEYRGFPVDCGPDGGLEKIEDIKKYFEEKGTIEEDLSKIRASREMIMTIHQPPWAVDLDVCWDGRRVGSKAVYDWIEQQQPLLVLCGHIHESYEVSHVWKARIGKTTVIQPGQGGRSGKDTIFTVIDIENEKVNAMRISL